MSASACSRMLSRSSVLPGVLVANACLILMIVTGCTWIVQPNTKTTFASKRMRCWRVHQVPDARERQCHIVDGVDITAVALQPAYRFAASQIMIVVNVHGILDVEPQWFIARSAQTMLVAIHVIKVCR